MSVKLQIVILAFIVALVVGLLLLDWRTPKNTEQSTKNDANESPQEHVHILQDKSPGEAQKESPRLNEKLNPAQLEQQKDSKEDSHQSQQKAIE